VAAEKALACEELVRRLLEVERERNGRHDDDREPAVQRCRQLPEQRLAAAGAEQHQAVAAAAHKLEAADLIVREFLRRRGDDASPHELRLLLIEIQSWLHLMREK
jgi:hypothetical protein